MRRFFINKFSLYDKAQKEQKYIHRYFHRHLIPSNQMKKLVDQECAAKHLADRKYTVLYGFFKKKRVNAEPIISGSFHIKNQRKKNKRRNLENKAFLLSEVLDKEKALGVIGIP